jgi:hypothetical protein
MCIVQEFSLDLWGVSSVSSCRRSFSLAAFLLLFGIEFWCFSPMGSRSIWAEFHADWFSCSSLRSGLLVRVLFVFYRRQIWRPFLYCFVLSLSRAGPPLPAAGLRWFRPSCRLGWRPPSWPWFTDWDSFSRPSLRFPIMISAANMPLGILSPAGSCRLTGTFLSLIPQRSAIHWLPCQIFLIRQKISQLWSCHPWFFILHQLSALSLSNGVQQWLCLLGGSRCGRDLLVTNMLWVMFLSPWRPRLYLRSYFASSLPDSFLDLNQFFSKCIEQGVLICIYSSYLIWFNLISWQQVISWFSLLQKLAWEWIDFVS